MCYYIKVKWLWPHSLAVRTPASHAGDRSSILRGATKKSTPLGWFFYAPGNRLCRAIDGLKTIARVELCVMDVEGNGTIWTSFGAKLVKLTPKDGKIIAIEKGRIDNNQPAN